jgi:SAM-dependent methyltransferase
MVIIGLLMINGRTSNESVDQRRVWQHFQGEASHVFADAKPRLEHLLKQIAKRATSAQPDILNVGAGDGYLELHVGQRGWRASSIDPDETTMAKLRQQGIDARAGTIAAAPFTDRAFDFVVASEILEHLTDDERHLALAEIHRLLKPQGWLIGTVPYAENLADFQAMCPGCGLEFHRWGHQASFTQNILKTEFASAKLTTISIRRTIFVDFKGPISKKFKSIARLMLARMGEPLANPLLYFEARSE